MKDYLIYSGVNRMTFSAANGAIVNLKRGSVELLEPSDELITLRLLGSDAVRHRVHGSGFSRFAFDNAAFSYSEHPEFPGLRIRIELRTGNGTFYFRPFVQGIPPGMYLELIDVPQLTAAASNSAVDSNCEGRLSVDPAIREKYWEKDDDIYQWNYPGRCQMQFAACYSDSGGVYFAAHDPSHAPKRPMYYADDKERLRLSMETFCGGSDQESYQSSFDYVVCTFDGDWMDAAALYRDWVKELGQLRFRRAEAEWLEDSPVVVVYSVRGKGNISAEPNSNFPYAAAMPFLQRIALETDSRIMALLMRWDCFGPWLPPYIWPPMGGVEALNELRDALHAEGHLIGLYGSGASWTQQSLTNDYSGKEQFEKEGLSRFMTCRPDGKNDFYTMRGIREGFRLCLTEAWSRETVKQQIIEIAEAGIDVMQFFDQDLGGTAYLCYSQKHAHPRVPGAWLTTAMSSLLAEIELELKQNGSRTILGTECAAAEPFIGHMPFSDLRPLSVLSNAIPVPMYQFVFHEYINNFMGNQIGASQLINEKCPDNLLYRTAYAFNAGDLLTVTLRDGGIIDWGAASDWNSVPPHQENALTLIRNLNAVRRRFPQFLRYGKMLKPILNLSGGKYELHLHDRVEVFDSFLHSSWQAPDGTEAQIIINFLPRIQKIYCKPPGDGCCVNGHIQCCTFEIAVPPLTAEVLHIS